MKDTDPQDEGVLCWVAQSYLTLCNPMDYNPPGSSVHGDSPGKNTGACQAPLSMGILQARTLEWVAKPSSRGSSQCRDWTQVSRITGGLFTVWTTMETQEHWSGKPIPSPRDLPNPDQTRVSCIAGRFFTSWATRKPEWWNEHITKQKIHSWLL